MSRVAKSPVSIPKGVEVKQDGQLVSVKGAKGQLELVLHQSVALNVDGDVLSVAPAKEGDKDGWAQSGTARSILNNMVNGVSAGFERKLELVGVGYRVQAKGNSLTLNVGYSNPVEFSVPEGVTAEATSQTEILLKSADKQLLGQVAANIRSVRPPEPYKGKGIRYSDEYVRRKEAKKK